MHRLAAQSLSLPPGLVQIHQSQWRILISIVDCCEVQANKGGISPTSFKKNRDINRLFLITVWTPSRYHSTSGGFSPSSDMSHLWEKARIHTLAARRCAQTLVLCQVPLLRHPSRTQIQKSHDYKHQAVLTVLSKRPQIIERIWISGNLVEQTQSLAEPPGLQHVGASRSFPPRSLQALWTRPPRSDLSLHFWGTISILLILHDSSHSHLCVFKQEYIGRDFLTSSIHLSFGPDGNNLKCKGCSPFYCVTPLFASLLRLFDLQ